jgi:hypothetical protein
VPADSELIIGSNASGIELHAAGILVFGALRAGADSCRLQTPVSITLHGSRPASASTATPDAALKGIHVSGGTLDFHGKRYFRTWTRLAAPAAPGQTTLWLQHAVNWEANQTIVLVSTELKDSRDWHRNEVLTIAAVLPGPTDSSIVHLIISTTHSKPTRQRWACSAGRSGSKVQQQIPSRPTSLPSPVQTRRECGQPHATRCRALIRFSRATEAT